MIRDMNNNLDKSMEKLRIITEQSLIGIVIIQDGLYKYFNNRVNEISGYSAEEIKSWAPYEFAKSIYPEDREFVMEQVRKKQMGDPDVINQYVHRAIRKDGNVNWIEIFAKTINYEGLPADLVMLIDITDKIIAEQKSKESEEKFRNIAEQSLMGINVLQDGVFKYLNDKFAEISGYSAEEMKKWGSNEWTKLIYPEDRKFVMEQAHKKQTGDPDVSNQYQFRVIRKDREIRWVEIFSKTITYEGRTADLAMLNDITDKIKAEQKLKESEEKFRNITNQSLVGISVLQDGEFKYFNDRSYEIAGYPREEMKNWTPNEYLKIIHPEDRKFISKQAFKKQAGDPDVVNQYQYRIITKDGETRWREIFSKTILYDGRPADLAMTIDITDKIKAEQKLKESEEKFRNITEQSLVGITILQDGVFKYFNNRVVETTGYPREEIKNWTAHEWEKVVHPEDREFVAEQARKKQSGDPDIIHQYQYRLITKNGETRWHEVFSKTIDYDGHPADLIMTIGISDKIIAEQKLKESEEKFRNITEQSLVGITVIQEGLFKYSNDRFIEIHGYPREEVISWAPNEFAKVIHPEDREYVMGQANKKQIGDPDVDNQYSYRIIRKDGEIRWLEILSKTITYEGSPADLAMVIDITDKIKAERDLRDSEEKFSKAFNTSFLSMSITSFEEGKFIEVNDAFLRFVGRSREEVIGKTTDELGLWLNEKVRKRFLRIIDKQGSLFNIETKDIPRKGEAKYGLVSYIKIILNDKPFILSILNDITLRKLAEKQLKESEEKFRNIADQSLMGITVIQDGLFKYFNKRVTEINGYSEEEIRNWAPYEFSKIFHPEDRDFVMKQARKKQAGDPDVVNQYQYRIVTKDGKIRWLEIFSKTITYEDRPADLAMTFEVTDKIKAELQLKESKEKYQQAYNQAEFYKDLFIHDINNTLQSLYSSIQLIDMDLEEIGKTNESKELIDIMYRQIKRGIKLISNVHKLSQLEDHEISIEEVDLFDVLKRSIQFINNAFQDRKIQIKCDIFSKKISILGNDLLQDVFENILINSVRYNNNNNVEIIIKASKVDQDNTSYCKLEFIDNGIGIEDERKEKVLTRVDFDAKTTYGMGLGLSLVKKIIDNYGGKIWIEDKVEGDYSKGTNVILLIQKGGS